MMNTYNNARKVSEQHAVVLVVAPVHLREVSLEVGDDGIVVVRAIPVGRDTAKASARIDHARSDSTYYLLTLTPLSSFCLKRSVLSTRVRCQPQTAAGRSGSHVLKNSTKCARLSRGFEHICLNNCSESSTRFVLGSSSKYCAQEPAYSQLISEETKRSQLT